MTAHIHSSDAGAQSLCALEEPLADGPLRFGAIGFEFVKPWTLWPYTVNMSCLRIAAASTSFLTSKSSSAAGSSPQKDGNRPGQQPLRVYVPRQVVGASDALHSTRHVAVMSAENRATGGGAVTGSDKIDNATKEAINEVQFLTYVHS